MSDLIGRLRFPLRFLPRTALENSAESDAFEALGDAILVNEGDLWNAAMAIPDAADRIEVLEAEVARLSAALSETGEGWRTIDSAPKDGVFLVYRRDGRNGRLPYSAGNSSMAVMMRNGGLSLIGTSFAFDLPEPTHWRPLPEGPASPPGAQP